MLIAIFPEQVAKKYVIGKYKDWFNRTRNNVPENPPLLCISWPS